VACLLAESINGLFFRNCVNFGLLALECPGVSHGFEELQTAEVSLEDFVVRNRDTGAVLQARPVPDNLLALMRNGGIFPLLEQQGLIAPAEAPA
jgi:3-isopropylmalate/(R)-2-methylmalate dehydratase small subunit